MERARHAKSKWHSTPDPSRPYPPERSQTGSTAETAGVIGSPFSRSYDSARCSRSELTLWGESQSHCRAGVLPCKKKRKTALPAPHDRACPRCLGNASYSPQQGAGGSNTRKSTRLSEGAVTDSRDTERPHKRLQCPQLRQKMYYWESGVNHGLQVRKEKSFRGWGGTRHTSL